MGILRRFETRASIKLSLSKHRLSFLVASFCAHARNGLALRPSSRDFDVRSKQTSTRSSAVLPIPQPQFGGVIGRKASESTPDFPKAVTTPKGPPNVLLIMTDDTGFGAASTFGGPIPTPTLDRLAKSGLRYNEFHTTALCSPNQDGAKYAKQRPDKTRTGTEKLTPGRYTIDFDFKYDGGGIGKGGLGTLTVDGKKVAESRIEQTSPLGKFTLDESFDVGEDTGTPVIDEYDAKMPFKFTGSLEKVQIKVGPNELPPQQRGELEQMKREFALAVQ